MTTSFVSESMLCEGFTSDTNKPCFLFRTQLGTLQLPEALLRCVRQARMLHHR